MKLGDGIAGRVAATALPLSYPQTTDDSALDVAFDEKLGCNIKQALCQPILGNNGHVRTAFRRVCCLLTRQPVNIALMTSVWLTMPGTWGDAGR